MQEFIDHLRSMDDDEIGFVLLGAHGARLRILDEMGLDFMDPATCVATDPTISIQLTRAIRQHQREGKLQYAAAAMVWLHSIRPFYVSTKPEQRTVARDMWRELSRGFPYVDQLLEEAHPNPLLRPDSTEMKMFPEGLSPR